MTQPRILVVHLIEGLALAGAERRLASDLRWLDRERYEHRVVCLRPFDERFGALRGEIEALGVPTMGLGMRSLRQWRLGLVALARLLRQWRPQLLHTQVFGADVYGRLAAAMTGVPLVMSTVQTIPYDRRLARFFSRKRLLADRLTARFLTHQFVAVSEPVRDALTAEFRIAPSRIRVIPNGVDLTRFVPRTVERRHAARASLALEPETCVVMAVGRLIPEKDHASLIRAFHRVAAQRPQSRLLVMGDGPLRDDLERLVQALGLGGRVSLLGARADVDRLLPAADLFVLPSLREGLPVALLEAMACEVPVIASSIPQNLGIVQTGETGWLVPPGDEQQLAQTILRIARNPSEAQAVGRRGREHVEARFSAETFARQLQGLYDELCNGPVPGALAG